MKRQGKTILDLIDAGLVQPGDTWFIRHRNGDVTRAAVTSRGTLRLGGAEYASPSTAASAALGGTAINGWMMWRAGTFKESTLIAQLRSELS